MKIIETSLPGVLIFEPKVFGDERGFFFESFNQQLFRALTGVDVTFVQDNHSKSCQGVLRGLHYQVPPHAQGKLVRVVTGVIFDVAVDIRPESATFGQWYGCTLSAENRRQMWIPAGLAHGFLTVSEDAEVLYKTTDYYAPAYERSLRWNDPTLAIGWPLANSPVLSPKDAAAPDWPTALKEIKLSR